MSFGLIMELYHVLFAFLFVGGIVSQNISFIQAAKANNLQTLCALLQLSDRCETFIVIPTAVCLLIFGFLTAWGQGWASFFFLNGLTFNWLTLSIALFSIPAPAFILVGYKRNKRHSTIRENALRQGQITPELRSVFRNKTTIAYRVIEIIIVVTIIALMVLKPL